MPKPVTRPPHASDTAIAAVLEADSQQPAPVPRGTLPVLDEALITAGTACALAGDISRMTLWRWRAAGIVPDPIVIRGRNYFRRGEFLAALARAGSTEQVNGD